MPLTADISHHKQQAATPTAWHKGHLADLALSQDNLIPIIPVAATTPLLPGYDLWDLWPVQCADGTTASFAGGTLWMILSAPALPNPDERHGVARIRLMLEAGGGWTDLGNFMPDGLCPGQREWAGSAVYDPSTRRITLYYTVAGRRGDTEVRFEQRLFEVSAVVQCDGRDINFRDWRAPHEIIVSDGISYMHVDGTESVPGFIKGFRDPAHFCDPTDACRYIVFTASGAHAASRYNGVIGIAMASGSGDSTIWNTLPPLIDADGLNNELERPHLIAHRGLYYLFWSTQRHMFAPDGPSGPTGLYGAVADSVLGPYRPLNGSGLVAANPDEEPRQSYSWWVCHDLSVVSFVDHWGLKGRALGEHPELNRAQFGGTPAPIFQLMLDGERAKIVAI